MPGTPPLGPAALPRALFETLPARRAILLLVLAVAFAAATALAAAPAGAQAGACAAADQPLGAAPRSVVEAAVLCRVNAERAAAGLAPVGPAAALEVAAQRHASDMVARRYFAHVSPSGGTVDKRARRAGYLTQSCWVLGEDLGWAPQQASSARAVVDAWMASPKHRAVILDGEFREAGIGLVARTPSGDAPGATFVLEMGSMLRCGANGASGTVRAAPRARSRTG